MRSPALRRLVPLAVLVAGLVLLNGAGAQKDEEGFKPLFNGKDMTGWKFILTDKKADPMKTFTVQDGIIVVTGKPNGYFHTEKPYRDYVLRFDWRYKRPDTLKEDKEFKGNSGILIHIQEPHVVWPKCVEVQGANADHGRIFGIGPKDSRAEFKGNINKKAQQEAIKPVGEWNTTEITCKGGEITCSINGKQVDMGKGNLMEGQIGFQSEGAEIHFRNIRIKETK